MFLTCAYDQNSVHSRVRRMMVRRRGGLERHYGGLLRGDSGASQASPDSDPVSEILSHLAGGGACVYVIIM